MPANYSLPVYYGVSYSFLDSQDTDTYRITFSSPVNMDYIPAPGDPLYSPEDTEADLTARLTSLLQDSNIKVESIFLTNTPPPYPPL